jgi:hypothetical protein
MAKTTRTYKYPSEFALIKRAMQSRKYDYVFFEEKGQEYLIMPNKIGNSRLENMTKQTFENMAWVK